jgi:O-antigen/teichoic acid export membrane protein
VAGSLSTLLQPRIARMREEGTYSANVRRFLWICLPAAGIAFLLALLLAHAVIALVLGETYAAGSGIFLWLLGGTLFWLAVTPLPLTMVAVHAPARIAVLTLLQSAIVVLAGLLLLPSNGPIGMAVAVFTMRVGVAAVVYFVAQRLTRDDIPLQQARPRAP